MSSGMTKLLPDAPRFAKASPCGFALVVTISLMVLLTVLAVGLLSLSAISLRSSVSGRAPANAKANARLALAIAMGELQKYAGPDQRITATADILDEQGTHSSWPKLVGVWKSWEGSLRRLDRQLGTAVPVAPSSYADEKAARHLVWLVSHPDAADPDFPRFHSPVRGDDLGELMEVETPSGGHYSWIVYDEGVKARIGTAAQSASGPANLSIEDLAERFSAPPRHGIEIWDDGFEVLPADDPEYAKAISYEELGFLGNRKMRDSLPQYFHDLTPYSRGLLVDVDRGGWKKDLSLLCEARSLPRDLSRNELASGQWSPKWDPPSGRGIYEFYNRYKKIRVGTSPLRFEQADSLGAIDTASYNNDVRVFPVLARAQLVFSYSSKRKSVDRQNPANSTYTAAILVTPVLTLWNPYNVPLRLRAPVRFSLSSMPFNIQPEIGRAYPRIHLSKVLQGAVGSHGNQMTLRGRNGSSNIDFGPGESMVFSPKRAAPVDATASVEMTPGFRRRGGMNITRLNPQGGGRGEIVAGGGETMRVELRYDNTVSDFGATGFASSVSLHINGYDAGGNWFCALRMNNVEDNLKRHLDPSELTGGDVRRSGPLKLLDRSPEIFASISIQLQTAADTTAPSLGLAQSNPLLVRTEVGRGPGAVAEWVPLCWADFQLGAHSGWNDTFLPQTDRDNHGFVASGIRADTGVTRAQIAEFPQRPLQSLAALQHYDVASNAFFTPHTFYAIGNSIACPTIPPDRTRGGVVLNEPYHKGPRNLDFHYLSNWKLFDHYFFSSIAPRPFRGDSLKQTFTAFAEGGRLLPNSRYVPHRNISPEDVDPSKPEASASWIASRLMVEGAFNINSTSVRAWAAFLASLNDSRPLYRDIHQPSGRLRTAPETDFVVSRFDIAGGGCADTDSADPNEMPLDLYWRGYRSLSKKQIEILAQRIVEQVKRRGPFLSLGEFVNRQLGNDRELAARGALQAALDDPAVDINDELKANSLPVTRVFAESMGYVFPEAAEGHTAFAAPGWVTQADLLRPMAPYITPRSDTFRIRTYGDSIDASGKVLARAWCEAVVQRVPEYVHRDADEDNNPDDGNSTKDSFTRYSNGRFVTGRGMSPVNQAFGRRFEIVSFRWLTKNEVEAHNRGLASAK